MFLIQVGKSEWNAILGLFRSESMDGLKFKLRYTKRKVERIFWDTKNSNDKYLFPGVELGNQASNN